MVDFTQYMWKSVKKIIPKTRGGWLTLLSFIALIKDDIQSILLQSKIFLPDFDIVTGIFVIGVIIGIIILVKDLFGNSIDFYSSREELPLLKKTLSQAKQEIIFIGVTLEKLIGQEASTIKDTIQRGVHMKFLILNSESVQLIKQDKNMISSTKHAITSQLVRICKIKSELTASNINKCEIRTYDSPLFYSITLSDPNSDNATMLVEFQLYDSDTELRPSILISKRKQKKLFNEYLKSYNYILDQSIEYQCQNSKKLLKE